MKRMDDKRHPHRNPTLLILGISSAVALAAFVNLVPPEGAWTYAVFFALVSATSWFLLAYMIRNTRHAALYSAGLPVYLILRLLDLTHPLYGILLLASIVAIRILIEDTRPT